MKWLCKFGHKWKQTFASIYEKPLPPPEMPGKYTFYAQEPQPKYVRYCLRCEKEEWSKEDRFGNVWFESPAIWQVER